VALNPSPTELTTAATDAAITLLSLLCLVVLRRHQATNPQRVRIWTWVFALLALASALGAVAHGLDLAATTVNWLWRPLYLALGLVVGLFVIGAVFDYAGAGAARRALLPMLVLAVGFFVLTQLSSGTFRLFVAYEGLAMLAALLMYGLLAWRRRLEGAGIVAAGILLNLLAAAIQATGTASLQVVVPFDHNGVFHLVQIIALALLTAGLARGMVHPQSCGSGAANTPLR
jgi:hypothetical protein